MLKIRLHLLLSLVCCLGLTQLYSQPMEMVGCHMRFADAKLRVDKNFEDKYFRATTERSDSFNIIDYDLTIDLRQMSSSLLKGEATVHFEPLLPDLQVITLDLLKMTVDSVKIEGVPAEYTYDQLYLNITMPEIMQIGQAYQVTVWYQGKPTISSSGFGGFYFQDGIAYNLGIGLTDDPHNFGRSWFPCFDNFVERSTYTYRIITSKDINAFSVGNLVSKDSIDTNSKMTTYRMSQEIPTYLSAIAASTYTTHEYVHTALHGDIPVQLICKPGDLQNVVSSFKNLNHAIDGLESWYGKYPFDRVGYVMTTVGAMEHPNCIAFPVSSVAGGNEARRLMAHELCHLWWGDLLTLRTQADMWIKEGNAEYGSHLFEEYLEGRESFETLVKSNRFEVITKAHNNDGGYLPLSPMPKRITYGMTTYNKGAMVMHSLRGYMGDDLFRQGQQSVLEEYAYKNLTAETYRASLEKSTGLDLEDFFNRWVLDSGFFDFVIVDFVESDVPEATHRLTIKQKLLKASTFLKDAPVWVTFIDDKYQRITQKFICTGEMNVFDINLPGVIKAAFINTPMTLNLAQFNSFKVVNTTGSFTLSTSGLVTRVDQIIDSTYLFVEQHMTEPDASQVGWTMNDRRFWRITYTDQDKIMMGGRINYNDDWEYNLVRNGEDSIFLVYRPNGFEDWTLYPYCTKMAGSKTDGRGNFQISNYLPGEYAFANVSPELLSSKQTDKLVELVVAPNPSTGTVYVSIPENLLTAKLKASVVDQAGHEINHKLTVQSDGVLIALDPSVASGTYHVNFISEQGKVFGHSQFMVVR